MIRVLTIVAAIAALAVTAAPVGSAHLQPADDGAGPAALAVAAAPVASAGTSKKPPSRAVDVKRGLDAAFEDGDELFETVFLRKAQPKLRGIAVTKATDIASTKPQRGTS